MSASIRLTPADDLQAAFDTAAENTVIHLSEGVYRCKTMIQTPGLRLIGAGAGKTVIIWDDYAKKSDAFCREYNTFRTYTLAVCADDVQMEDLSIVNDALHPETKGQEVALSVVADRFVMRRCTLRSTQDTLFCGPLPPDLIARYDGFLHDSLRRGGELNQLFEECTIEGTVDFIFGCGNVLFRNCLIRSLNDARNVGYVAAPAHSLTQTAGLTFRRCSFVCEEGVAEGSIYLARPWRDYGLSTFEDCAYGPHIAPEGFDKWSGTQRDLTARFYEHPPVPGRVTWVNRKNQ